MNQFMTHIGLVLAIAVVMSACSGNSQTVKREGTATVNQSQAPAWTAEPKYVYGPATVSSLQPKKVSLHKSRSSIIYYGPFQKPSELGPAVEFWRKTYTHWQFSKVAFHDNRYMDVIYEVMTLPGYVGESLTPDQKEMVTQRRDYWKAQLFALENKLRYNVPLNAMDRQLVAQLQSSGRPFETVLKGAAERVRSQRGMRERFLQGMEISQRYDRQFRRIFRDAGLPEDLAYLPHVESSFQSAARSSAGAVGMWQFTRAAAQRFMPHGHKQIQIRSYSHKRSRAKHQRHKGKHYRKYVTRPDPRLDPFISAKGAAHYLSYAYSKLGDWPSAITSYNHGIGGMQRAQDEVGRDFVDIVENYGGPAFGFASRNYYAQFLAVLEIARNPMQSGSSRLQYGSSLNATNYLSEEKSESNWQ